MHIVKIIHPILMPLLKTKLEHKLHYLNNRPRLTVIDRRNG